MWHWGWIPVRWSDYRRLVHAVDAASASARRLAAAVAAWSDYSSTAVGDNMANATATGNPSFDDIIAQVTAVNTVLDSTLTFMAGLQAMIQAAIATAIAGGATPAQLAQVQTIADTAGAKAAAVAAAIVANTPTPPVVPPTP